MDSGLYLADSRLEEANPLESLSANFPPTLVMVGSNEVLGDDSKEAYRKISVNQIRTKLSVYKDQSHVWLMDDIHAEPAQKALHEINEFVNFANRNRFTGNS